MTPLIKEVPKIVRVTEVESKVMVSRVLWKAYFNVCKVSVTQMSKCSESTVGDLCMSLTTLCYALETLKIALT